MAYKKLDLMWAYNITEIVRILALLFVNDGILTTSREVLRTQFETLKAELANRALKLNPEKCESLVLLPNKKMKYTVVDTHLCLRWKVSQCRRWE